MVQNEVREVSRSQHSQAPVTHGMETAYNPMYNGKPLKNLRRVRQD